MRLSLRRAFRWFVPHALRAGALVIVSALPAVAQDDRLLRLDQGSRYIVDAAIDSARALGLPSEPLRSLALQGIQKKADNRRIAEAVRAKFIRLKTAYSILGAVGDQELDAASAVLEAGARPTQLAAFKPRQKGRNDLEAFTVWADLIARGVPGDDASAAITRLWQDGADEATFRRLWNDVSADISQGLNPGAALQNRIREAPVRTTPKPNTPEG
jgi:hypothetical protein